MGAGGGGFFAGVGVGAGLVGATCGLVGVTCGLVGVLVGGLCGVGVGTVLHVHRGACQQRRCNRDGGARSC